MGDLTAEALRQELLRENDHRQCEFHEVIGSTNTRALELAAAGVPSGTLVVADSQTSGRGRLGRSWESPVGSSLLFSLVLRPELLLARAQWMTMICSLAAVRAIEQVCDVAVGIKWPNDLAVSGKKLGGVLTELRGKGKFLDCAIVGMGINVNVSPEALGPVMTPATSLLAEHGAPVSRLELLVALLGYVDEYLIRVTEGWAPHGAWQAHLVTLGKAVSVGTREGVVHGVAIGVDEVGALLVEGADGEVRRFYAGDVTLRGHQL